MKELTFIDHFEKCLFFFIFLLTVKTFHAIFIWFFSILLWFVCCEDFHLLLLCYVVLLDWNEEIQTNWLNLEESIEERLILTFRYWWLDLAYVELDALLNILTFEFDKDHLPSLNHCVYPEEEQVRLSPVLLARKWLINKFLKFLSFLRWKLIRTLTEPSSFLFLYFLLSNFLNFVLNWTQFPKSQLWILNLVKYIFQKIIVAFDTLELFAVNMTI